MSANIQVNTTKEYPQVHSLEESLAILRDIVALVKQCVYGLSGDEIIKELKEKGFVDYESK